MNLYETIIINSPDLPADKMATLVEKVKSFILQDNGEILAVNEWGKRKLAYGISGHREGIYTYIEYKCDGKAIRNLENTLKVTEGILRYLTIKKRPRKQAPPAPVKTQDEQAVTPAAAEQKTAAI